MADILAIVGILIMGAVGGAAAMMFLGYRRPLQHERALFKLMERFRDEVKEVSRQYPK